MQALILFVTGIVLGIILGAFLYAVEDEEEE